LLVPALHSSAVCLHQQSCALFSSVFHHPAVCDEYRKLSSKELVNVIKSEVSVGIFDSMLFIQSRMQMSGDLETGLIAVVRSAKEPEAYFAEKLRKSMVGKIHL
jgi:hypothetical protein